MGAAVGQAETLGEQRQQATETAAKRGETLESCIAMLEEAGREAWRQVRQLNSQSAASCHAIFGLAMCLGLTFR